MSEEEKQAETFPEEFEEEELETHPSESCSDLGRDTSQEEEEDPASAGLLPQLVGEGSSVTLPQVYQGRTRLTGVTSPTSTLDMADIDPDVEEEHLNLEEVEFNGMKIAVEIAPKKEEATQGTIIRMEDRAQMPMEKRTELFTRISDKKLDNKFELMSLSLTDADTLDDTYNLNMLIGHVQDHLTKYDVHGVFDIVNALNPSQEITFDGTKGNLFNQHSTITTAQVARSNEWYRRWPKGMEYQNNLRLSADFLQKNTSEALWEKCMEAQALYPKSQHGGPLLFIILMKKIQSNTEDAVHYLIERIRQLKLTQFDGENVDRAISMLRGARMRLTHSRKGVPDDLGIWILKIFYRRQRCTSSMNSFVCWNAPSALVKPLTTTS
jgi:hypothetical protein